MKTVKQYVIVAHKNVIIRPFHSIAEARDWAESYAGVHPETEYIIQLVKHIDISSRFNLQY